MILLGALSLTLEACAATEAGTPSAVREESTANTSEPGTSTTQPPVPTSSALTGTDPCSLLTSSDATSLGLPPQGRRADIIGLLICTWPKPGSSVSVNLDPGRGIKDVGVGSATKTEDVVIGKHQGRRVEESSGPGYCSFDLAITDETSARISAIILGKTAEACKLAEQVTKIVEPKLP